MSTSPFRSRTPSVLGLCWLPQSLWLHMCFDSLVFQRLSFLGALHPLWTCLHSLWKVCSERPKYKPFHRDNYSQPSQLSMNYDIYYSWRYAKCHIWNAHLVFVVYWYWIKISSLLAYIIIYTLMASDRSFSKPFP